MHGKDTRLRDRVAELRITGEAPNFVMGGALLVAHENRNAATRPPIRINRDRLRAHYCNRISNSDVVDEPVRCGDFSGEFTPGAHAVYVSNWTFGCVMALLQCRIALWIPRNEPCARSLRVVPRFGVANAKHAALMGTPLRGPCGVDPHVFPMSSPNKAIRIRCCNVICKFACDSSIKKT